MTTNSAHLILMAEDDEDDRDLALAAFREADVSWTLEFVKDGQELMEYLRGAGDFVDPPRPSLIVLDLNMPRKDGREALSEIKSDDALREIPILVLSTSSDDGDIRQAYRAGANSFICKPSSQAGLVEVVRRVREYWLDLVALPQDADRTA